MTISDMRRYIDRFVDTSEIDDKGIKKLFKEIFFTKKQNIRLESDKK